jgi:hypothetical protein
VSGLTTDEDVRVRGIATAEEVAAVLAALRTRERRAESPQTRYERWRRQRVAALRDNE